MKNKILLSTFIVFLFTHNVNSQGVSFDWAEKISGNGVNAGHGTNASTSVTTDASGNVYFTGRFDDTLDFDPGPGIYNLVPNLNSVGALFISKMDPNGNLIWAKMISGGPASDAGGNSITTDTYSNIYITGGFTDTVDFDPGIGVHNLIANANSLFGNIFILKLDSAGNYLWVKEMGILTVGQILSNSIITDPNNNVLITGSFSDTVDFDPGPSQYSLISSSIGMNGNAFIAKLNSSGNFLWAKSYNGVINNYDGGGDCITTDLNSNVYTTGYFSDTTDFDPGSGINNLIPYGFEDMFVSKLDSNGNFIWANQLGNINLGESGGSIAVDGSNHSFVLGRISGANHPIFISKYDSLGNLQWVKYISDSALVYGTSIVLDATNNCYFIGAFKDSCDFDPGIDTFNLMAIGTSMFITKLDSAGNFQWAKIVSGSNSGSAINASDITIDGTGNIYFTGDFQRSTTDFDPSVGVFNLTANPSEDAIFLQKLSQCTYTYSNITQSSCDSLIYNGQTFYTSGIFSQIINNSVGCDSIITLNLSILQDFNPIICLVTVDSTSNFNTVVWEKPPGLVTVDSFFVYREISFNNYQKIGAVHADSLSVFNDLGSNPNSTSYKYKLTALDTCGNETPLSLYHNTIHLQYLGLGNFQWTSYQIESTANTVASYNFYRDDNSTGNFQLLQVIPGGNNTFTDVNYLSFPNASYRVDVAWITGGICNPTRSTISTSLSNIKSLLPTSVNSFVENNKLIKVYPTPTNDLLNIEINFNNIKNVTIELKDVLGRDLIHPIKTIKSTVQISTEDFVNGFYFLIIRNGDEVFSRKITVEHP